MRGRLLTDKTKRGHSEEHMEGRDAHTDAVVGAAALGELLKLAVSYARTRKSEAREIAVLKVMPSTRPASLRFVDGVRRRRRRNAALRAARAFGTLNIALFPVGVHWGSEPGESCCTFVLGANKHSSTVKSTWSRVVKSQNTFFLSHSQRWKQSGGRRCRRWRHGYEDSTRAGAPRQRARTTSGA